MMITKLLAATAIAMALGAMSATPVHAQVMSDTEWNEMRAFLEDTPALLDELRAVKARALPSDQHELDAAFLAENLDTIASHPLAQVLGNPEGEVVLVKFSDYQCGYCAQMSGELATVIAEDARVRVVIRELPVLGEASESAARFAIATEELISPEAYQAVKGALFDASSDELLDSAFYEGLMEASGFEVADPEAFEAYMYSDEVTAYLEETRALAAELRITGTPAIIVKDVVVRGAIPAADLQTGIAQLYPAAE